MNPFALLAPLFFTFELWQLVVSERYLGIKQIARGADPRALGLLVVSNEGRPTKVEGNERHPANLGASNVWAQNAIYDLYDPDRSRVVLQTGAEKTS